MLYRSHLIELNRFAGLVPCCLSGRAFLFVEPLPSQLSGQRSWQVVTGWAGRTGCADLR